MSTRQKGHRIQRLAVAYAYTFPNVLVLTIYQVSRWATPQPFDLIVFRTGRWPRFVEVRSNQWRTGKASTKQLAHLPGEGFHRQMWLHRDRREGFKVRSWDETTQRWLPMDNPF